MYPNQKIKLPKKEGRPKNGLIIISKSFSLVYEK